MKKLFLLLMLPSLLITKPFEPSVVDRQILSHTFNEEFEHAKKLSSEQIKLNPNSPKYYYYLINTKILEYYKRLTELDAARRDEGRKAINKEIIDYCENVIDKFDVDKLNVENKFYYGSIYGYLARIYGIDRSWWGAFKSGMKAEDIMEEVLKTDPQFYDAYLVLGMLNYYADRLSGITSFVAGILGYSGDRDKGLYQLQLAYDKGKLTFGQTSLTLIEVYANLEDNDYATLTYYEKFLKQYPKSKRALNAYCHELMGLWELKKVESIIQNDKEGLLEDYTKARYYSMIGNNDPAIQFAERAIENENNLWRGAGNYVRYLIAFNSWIAGNTGKMKKYEPELSDDFKEIFSTDKKYYEESKWLHNLSIKIALDGSINEIETLAKSKPAFNGTANYEDQFNSLMGMFYFKNNLFEKSEQYYGRNINSEDEGIKYTSLKHLIDIYLRQNISKAKVEKLLDTIDDFDNDRLKFRAKDLEKKYNL